jgi:dihydropteroate synthase type 2
VRIVGVVNITEDSFSDGGRYLEPEAAIAHARRLRSDGADVVELGAASSHPDATAVSADEERRRLTPVLEALAGDGVPVSVDTTEPETQRLALAHGAAYLNDVRGFPAPRMYEALAAGNCRLVVMHSIEGREIATRVHTEPARIWARIDAFFGERLAALQAGGIAHERLVVDPGLGFFLGANPEPSIAVLGAICRLRARFGAPVLVSPSRKSFLRALTGRGIADIGPATLAAELYAARRGVDYIRTHDVRALTDALKVERVLQERHEPDPVELVREWYERMNAGDVAGAAAKLHPEIEWFEAEHSPYGWPGPPLVGVAAVADAVWSRLARDWVDLRVVPEEFVPAADGVAVTGRYVGRHARSGAPLDAQVLHLWTVADGVIRSYRGFADTYALHKAMEA